MCQIKLIEVHSSFLHSICFFKVLKNWQSVVKMCQVDNVMDQIVMRMGIIVKELKEKKQKKFCFYKL